MPESQVMHTSKKDPKSVLDSISSHLPTMERAVLLQSKAAEYGFDWSELEPVFEKLQEEINELKHECQQISLSVDHAKHQLRLQDELGDVIFCCMNLARFLKVDPDKALNSTNNKFERRFGFIEAYFTKQGKSLKDISLEELDSVWDLAKTNGL